MNGTDCYIQVEMEGSHRIKRKNNSWVLLCKRNFLGRYWDVALYLIFGCWGGGDVRAANHMNHL